MEPTLRTIVVYKAANDTHPYFDWFDHLKDRQAKVAVAKRIDRLSLGLLGDHKALGDGLYELRIHVGPGYRVYFAQEDNAIILILAGGSKSSQSQDIQTAKDYHHDYKSH